MSRRILVVDDDRMMVSTLSDILEMNGWDVEPAHSGEEALACVAARQPDVVLMDVKMGGIDGVDALKAMRASHPGIRVVLMTAFSASTLLQDAVDAGAIEVLHKPVDMRHVLSLLESLESTSPTVLVVDDNISFLKTLTEAISSAGYEVSTATDLSEALDRLHASRASIVVLDMMIPRVEPEDLVVAIRQANPAVMFILYSGHPKVLRATRAKVPDDWVRGCLYKPFEMPALLQILDACVGR